MAKWIIKDCFHLIEFERCDTLMDAETRVIALEAEDKAVGGYQENYYDIVYDGVNFSDLSTTAKTNCMSEFLGKVIPYGWDEVNDGEIADLEDTILYTIGSQFWFDEDGNWYDESIGRL